MIVLCNDYYDIEKMTNCVYSRSNNLQMGDKVLKY